MSQLAYIIWLSIVEVVGDFALESYAHTGVLSSLGIGVLGYAGVVALLLKSLKGSTILYVNGMWDGVSCLIESAAAYILLGERLESPLQYVGLLMVIFGIMLLKKKVTIKA